MASLRKRGKYYYIRFTKMVDGETSETSKSLGITQKAKAEEACKQLEEMEARGEINPYTEGFNPKSILKERRNKKTRQNRLFNIDTMRKAADYFYQKKSHLSDKTVNTDAKKPNDWGAYQRAIENFLSVNDIENIHPAAVTLEHFEALIFKKDIKTATRKFYFRQLRVFWNYLMDRDIVSHNYIKQIDKDLPDDKENVRSKMISEEELQKLFNAFDKELDRKKEMKEFTSRYAQRWFKPMMACFFYGGLRKSEVAFDSSLDYSGLKGKNLEYINGELEMIFIPATKGRKERVIPISQKWKEYLLPYLEQRGPVGNNDYIFVYWKDTKAWPVTGSQAYNEFKRYLDLAGLPKERTIHGMRHGRITRWLEEGYTLKEGQLMAGHSNTKVTEGYTHLVGRNLLEKQRKIESRNQ